MQRVVLLLLGLLATVAFCTQGSIFGEQGAASIPNGLTNAGVFITFVTKSVSGSIDVSSPSGTWIGAGNNASNWFPRIKYTGYINSTCATGGLPPVGTSVTLSVVKIDNVNVVLPNAGFSVPNGGGVNVNAVGNFGYINLNNPAYPNGGLVGPGLYGLYLQRQQSSFGPGTVPCAVSAGGFSAEFVIGA